MGTNGCPPAESSPRQAYVVDVADMVNISAASDAKRPLSLTSSTPKVGVNIMPFLGRAGPRRSLIGSGIVASAGTDSRDAWAL